MTSNRLKRLGNLRLLLSLIAVLLVGTMIFSAVMAFRPAEDPGPTGDPDAPLSWWNRIRPKKIPIQTEPSELPTEPAETDPPQNPNPAPGGGGKGSNKNTEPPETAAPTESPTEPATTPTVGNETDGTDSGSGTNNDNGGSGSNNDNGGTGTNNDNGGSGSNNDNGGSGSNNDNGGTGTNNDNGGSGSNNDNGGTGTNNDNGGSGSNNDNGGSGSNNDNGGTGTNNDNGGSGSNNDNGGKSGSGTGGTTSGGMTTSPSETEATVPVAETSGEADNSFSKEGEKKDDPADKGPNIWLIVLIVSSVLFVADVAAIIYLTSLIKKEQRQLARRIPGGLRQNPEPSPIVGPSIDPISSTQVVSALPKVATVHQVGRRNYQQDSLGHAAVLGNQGFLAVVADGMGGLSGGEKVSQKIVTDMLTMGHQLKPGQTAGILWTMVNQINDNVNRMLGPDGLYKSGSTLISVLVHSNRFQWISVGDSRIYLYREGYANQLNQDHDQLQAWMPDILEGRVSMAEAIRHPDGRKLTSFIGMGQLKHIDGSVNSIALEPGDRILLVSDGIYGVVDENRMADILKRYPDIDQAAAVIEQVIRESNSPHQDNYTAIILGF